MFFQNRKYKRAIELIYYFSSSISDERRLYDKKKKKKKISENAGSACFLPSFLLWDNAAFVIQYSAISSFRYSMNLSAYQYTSLLLFFFLSFSVNKQHRTATVAGIAFGSIATPGMRKNKAVHFWTFALFLSSARTYIYENRRSPLCIDKMNDGCTAPEIHTYTQPTTPTYTPCTLYQL